jgi:hypothetical protein
MKFLFCEKIIIGQFLTGLQLLFTATIHIRPQLMKISQRWSSEAPNGGVFAMWIEQRPWSLHFLSLAPRGSICLEHLSLKVSSRGAYAWLPTAWTPLFTAILPYLTTYCPDLCHFHMTIKNIIATKLGQNGAVLSQIPYFPKKRRKVCQKGWKTKFHQTWFLAF